MIAWWHWLAVGLILVALEMAASGGFYIIFFGIAAIAIALLQIVDLSGPVWVQLVLFAILSVGSLLLFRNPLLRWLKLDRPGVNVDSMVGDLAVPLEDIAPGAVGRAELRGTVWSARNRAARVVSRGERCRVLAVDQLMIFIEPEGAH
jgi:membrane protein implicated in regulation of membrane protease activity